ncbi:GntR family transcriptional regulator [Moraxella caviae]|uniref:GntR family transcriptional regulator n=1 Tax=Moraxella caviae TaxID=34060 RepID=A0A1S9ZWJ3_9GAMM|nr:GntR family transcriptional regulator [Moraxella caviae]OOR87800.1 GntR family transcriptional regulator [Moraxella caviae]STZ10556.1 Uncharacterized HTH-type transcriptional regulator ydfH [Moraxella caviae]VEW12972.1 Uncharacterized HTH-type transcriptional regulator ydfH [Moraxella caviae]
MPQLSPPTKPAAKTTNDKKRHSGTYVYERLREQILRLILKPNTQLDEISLAERFGVSRSPVRDALARLVADGLASTLPNRSTVVSSFHIEEFPQYIAALDLLQRATTRLAAMQRTDEELAEMMAVNDCYIAAAKRRDFHEMFEENKRFHILVAQAGKNDYLAAHYTKLLDEGQRLLYVQFDYLVQNFDEQVLEKDHDGLLVAISQQDADLAERMAHEHTLLFQRRFLDYMGQNSLYGMAVEMPNL